MKNRLVFSLLFILVYPHYVFSQKDYTDSEIAGLSINAGANYLPFSGKTDNYFMGNPIVSGPTLSLDFFGGNYAFFLSMANATTGRLKQNLTLGESSWGERDRADFYTYSISVGRTFYSKYQSFRLTPFIGAHLSYLRPSYEGEKRPPELKKFNADGMLSPSIGMNLNYRFTNSKKYTGETTSCFGLFARASYIPFAIHKSKFDYSGSAWCFTLGVSLEIFQAQKYLR